MGESAPPPKHGGCYDCKTKEVPVLVSIPVPGQVMSKAVCEACARKYLE